MNNQERPVRQHTDKEPLPLWIVATKVPRLSTLARTFFFEP